MKNPSLKSTHAVVILPSCFMMVLGNVSLSQNSICCTFTECNAQCFPVLLHDVCQALLHVFCLSVLLGFNSFFCCYPKSLQLAPRIFSLLGPISVQIKLHSRASKLPSLTGRNFLCGLKEEPLKNTVLHHLLFACFLFSEISASRFSHQLFATVPRISEFIFLRLSPS